MHTLIIGNYTLSIEGELPAPKKPVLLIIGGAPGAEDQAKAFKAETDCDVAAVNGAITRYTGALTLAISLHEDKLPDWVAGRKYKQAQPVVISSDSAEGVDVVVGLDRAVASSAMHAALVGKAAGYQRIVLCGVTQEREGEKTAYQPIWRAAKAKGALDGVESIDRGWLAALLKA